MKKFIAACLAALVSAGDDAVKELTTTEGLKEEFEKYEFNVLSMYMGSDSETKEVDALMEPAKAAFEDLLKTNDLPERSVGWFRADIEKYPDLDMQGIGMADQMVINTKNELSRFLHYSMGEETKDHDADLLATLVRFLTGEYYEPIKCD